MANDSGSQKVTIASAAPAPGSKPVRVRFAPSPTGYLHVGGARTALYNYLYAKRFGGQFILRVEDTDLERSTEESMRMQIADLKWLGLSWDEGPDSETYQDRGPHGPYRQSRRREIYQEHAERLLERGLAYYDFRTDAELEALKAEAQAQGRPHQADRPEKIVPLDEARQRLARGERAAIRFRTGEKRDYVLQDLIRGSVTFPSDMVGDFVCIRSNGMPVYNFCCVIDDALMKISHVFRAEEHLSNTLRQMMLYEAFGYEAPLFGHLSIILGPDRQKLSKRHGATSCNDYRLKGYLPEALNNFILLLGWSSPLGQEVMSREQMIEQFTHERFNAAAAVFDEAKLQWMNSVHLRGLESDELWRRVEPFLKEAGLEMPGSDIWRQQALAVFKTSMLTLKDAVDLFLPLADNRFAIHETASEALSWPESRQVLSAWTEALKDSAEAQLTEAQFVALQDLVKAKTGTSGKKLFQPIRVAVIGQPQGAELKTLVPLLPRESLIRRAQTAMSGLKS
jgi:nondiscriminating glutamyl-tRNA synthetase